MSPTRLLGPHDWQDCPRRSPEPARTCSAPTSPSLHKHRSLPSFLPNRYTPTSIPNQVPLDVLTSARQLEHMDPALVPAPDFTSKSVPDLRPPFVVRHVDNSLLSERNFCGATTFMPLKVKHEQVSVERHGGETKKGFVDKGADESAMEIDFESSPKNAQGSPRMSSPSNRRSSPRERRAGSPHSPVPTRSLHLGRREDLVSKYLVTSRSEKSRQSKHEFGLLARTIEEKIERLKQECCECLVSLVQSAFMYSAQLLNHTPRPRHSYWATPSCCIEQLASYSYTYLSLHLNPITELKNCKNLPVHSLTRNRVTAIFVA